MNLGPSERVEALLPKLKQMILERIEPAEHEFYQDVDSGGRWTLSERQLEILETLKTEARSQGLWNFFLTHSDRGPGLSNVEYAYLAELMGRCHLASEVFNCSAPDTGNMEVLDRFGSDEQKQRWLEPLLDGRIRSAFAMTEPDVASSDATNIAARAVRDGDDWVINGSKTYISGAGDPRCEILIVMALTEPEGPRHAQHSQILVPMDAPGVERLRPMEVFGQDDAPHGHFELSFTDVRVPAENVILGPGRGFEIAQRRLGPGRIHHCMRAIGAAERALGLMCERGMSRIAFGKPLAKLGGNVERIADARMAIEQARLLTLKAAWVMDQGDPAAAQRWVSMIKVVAPNVALKVIDQAIQMHGGAGVSQDFPLAGMYSAMRTLRLADGPDEVHRMVVARAELAPYRKR